MINIGKDGIGAVSSSGQGSLWRMEALKGRSPDGTTGVDPKDLGLVGKQLGFRAEMLIEDTHTSIELFRQVGGVAWSGLIEYPTAWVSRTVTTRIRPKNIKIATSQA